MRIAIWSHLISGLPGSFRCDLTPWAKPAEVHMIIRFCISWLLGKDITTWSARKVLAWLQHNVGASNVNTSLMYVAWASKMDPCPLASPGCTLVPNPRVYRAMSRISLPPPRRYEPFGVKPTPKRRPVVSASKGGSGARARTSVVIQKDTDM